MTKVIGFISGKGGVGKTTSTIDTASALQLYGRNVIILDGNLTAPHIGLYLGVPIDHPTVHDALKRKVNVKDIVFMHSSGLKVIPANISFKEMKEINFAEFPRIINELRGYAEIVIVDSPSGFAEDARAVMAAMDAVVIITNPEVSAVADALKCIKLAEELKKEVIGIVVNKTKSDGFDIPLKSIHSILEKNIIGVVPEDTNVRKSMTMRAPVLHSDPNSPASDAFRKVASYLIGGKA